MDWIKDNSDALQLGLTMLSAVVWLAYLHILYMGFVRQRQAVVMIHHGAAPDDRARCIISNMGSEPICIIALQSRLDIGGEVYHASVIDREELTFDSFEDPLKRTNQGPLKSGEFHDVGSFRDLIYRVRQRHGLGDDVKIDMLEVTVGAASGHASKLVVASREFSREEASDGTVSFVPTTLLTRQVRGRWTHRKLLRRLDWTRPA